MIKNIFGIGSKNTLFFLYKIHKKHTIIALKNSTSLKNCIVTVLKFKMLLE